MAQTQARFILETNYIKFFQDTFKDKGFQDKWTQLEEIRHKVAHSNLFTIEDSTLPVR